VLRNRLLESALLATLMKEPDRATRAPRSTPVTRPPGTWIVNSALAALALVAVIVAIEAAFRIAPSLLLPAGSYGAGRLHPDLALNVHGAPVLYNKTRFLERHPNHEGFMDVDHTREKSAGRTRVGFFGDSYVEAVQVPLEDVFFRRLAATSGADIEPIAFGMSGWGTLHAMRAWETFGDAYDLDVIVYVFVENDLGDQAWEIARHRDGRMTMPYAVLAEGDPGFAIHWPVESDRVPLWYRTAKRIQSHSLLAQVVFHRWQTLRGQGVRVRASRDAIAMDERAASIPDSNDLPGSWPPAYVEVAEGLGERVLRAWKAGVDADGDQLVVLYVPRSQEQLLGSIPLEDTWKPWLDRTCARLGIELIDPSEALRKRLAEGEAVYDDHWTAAGHEVIAELLAQRLRKEVRSAGSH
jgi:hypothetical protein